MSNYRAGRDFEHLIRTKLRNDGYEVIRSAGSKTKVDLVAIKAGQVLFVQCKKYGAISPAERAEVCRIAGLLPQAGVAIVARREGVRGKVTFRELTGPGPKDWRAWTPDEVNLGAQVDVPDDLADDDPWSAP